MRMQNLRRYRLAAAIAAVGVMAGSTSLWLRAQAADTRAIPALMPPGALLYLEAKDFGSVLGSWNSSAEKRRWLASANFQVVSLSRLVERLSQAHDEFADVGGVPIGMDLAHQVAGTRSGFAFYNLSELSFVYITQMPLGRVETTTLWRSRTRYQSREVAGIPFYVKSDQAGKRIVAFTSYKDWFVIATDEDRMAETLVLLSGAQQASLASATWFTQATKQLQTQGDLRLVYNLEALLATPQFRTYWIQRNASELRPFGAGISDLFQTQEGFEEQRAMLRASEVPARVPDQALAEALAHAAPASSLYRAWSTPDENQLSDTFQQVISGIGPTAENFNARAPDVRPEASAVGAEADLEIRIDDPPFQRSSEPSLQPLVDAVDAMQPVALLHVQTTTVVHDQVFVLPNSGAVVICKQANQERVNQAVARLGALQTGALDPLRVSVEGNAVILTRMDLVRARSAVAVAPDVTYTAVYNHRAEWPRYKKLFAVVDTRAANPEMAVSNSTPTFFSSNVQSLGDSLARLQSASMTSADHGAVVRETVRYRFVQR